MLTRYQNFLGKYHDAFYDSTYVFRDHFRQNNDFEKFPRGQVNTLAANYEYTRTSHRILLYMEKCQDEGISRSFEGQRVSTFDSTLNFTPIWRGVMPSR